jgi:hypothetical protein
MLTFDADKRIVVLADKWVEYGRNIFPEFITPTILYDDLLNLMSVSDYHLSLECMTFIEVLAETDPLDPFEWELITFYLKNCMLTTFPDYRAKFYRTLLRFFHRLRTVYGKEIRWFMKNNAKFTFAELSPEERASKCPKLLPLLVFLQDITSFAERSLYLDKPIEGSFPLFDVLKILQDFFGGITYQMNKGAIFDPLNFLEFCGLLQSQSLFIYLVNAMKSSWATVRIKAFELLSRYPDGYVLFNDSHFVNKVLLPAAFEFCNEARAMLSEASGLMLKLVWLKCMPTVDMDALMKLGSPEQAQSWAEGDRKLALMYHVLCLVKQRLATFTDVLITEGKTTGLLHGLLSFYKHVFADF